MLNELGIQAFEASLRKLLNERRKQLDMSLMALGRLAYPYVIDSRRKAGCFVSTERYDVQALRGAEILNACEALGLEWQDVMAKALAEAEAEQEKVRLADIRKRQSRRKAEVEAEEEVPEGRDLRKWPPTRPKAGGGSGKVRKRGGE